MDAPPKSLAVASGFIDDETVVTGRRLMRCCFVVFACVSPERALHGLLWPVDFLRLGNLLDKSTCIDKYIHRRRDGGDAAMATVGVGLRGFSLTSSGLYHLP